MGDYFLFALLTAFGVYEGVMHFVFKNEPGSETLSALTRRLEVAHPWLKLVVGAVLVALFPHLVLGWY